VTGPRERASPPLERGDQPAYVPLEPGARLGQSQPAGGDTAHEQALKEMKGRWKHPIKGMGWYKETKREFAALPDD